MSRAKATIDRSIGRRALLRFLLSSPLTLSCAPRVALEFLLAPSGKDSLARAADAINVFDFERVAERRLTPAHWTYLSMGVQHEVTLRANRSAFDQFQLRPRRLVDTRELDTSQVLLGQRLSSPFILSPCGSQKAFHRMGELAVARAARSRDWAQILSINSSTPLDEVTAARGGSVWFQLYTPRIMAVTRLQLRQAEEAGCPVVVLTVDQAGLGGNRDQIRRYRRSENPNCRTCHGSIGGDLVKGAGRALRALGLDTADWLRDLMTLDWSVVDRIRDSTQMKFVIKGILTPEDAQLCVNHGVDGIIVSNHGGRAEDSGLSTIEVLPEIVAAVQGRIPVIIDSGFRRGTDAFKALALGASAVCIGRPYLWGLAAFGQEGTEAVLDILDEELRETMVEMGTPKLSGIGASHVRSVDPSQR